MAQFTEEELLMRRITKHFRKGVVNYRLIDDGDAILVGLSGGKDSLALLELLAARARIHRPHFQVKAVYVCMTNIPYQTDVEYLRSHRFYPYLRHCLYHCHVSAQAPRT